MTTIPVVVWVAGIVSPLNDSAEGGQPWPAHAKPVQVHILVVEVVAEHGQSVPLSFIFQGKNVKLPVCLCVLQSKLAWVRVFLASGHKDLLHTKHGQIQPNLLEREKKQMADLQQPLRVALEEAVREALLSDDGKFHCCFVQSRLRSMQAMS